MTIRDIEEKDLEHCAILYADVFAGAPWNEPWTEQAAFERLRHFYRSVGFVGVLAESDSILGFALGNTEPFHTEPWFYLREMCIAPEHQGQGLGSQVFGALQKKLYAGKAGRIYLATERSIPAAKFYIKNGFKHMGEMGFFAKPVSA